MVLSFHDKREVKEYLGFVTRSENVCFERWRISIVLLDNPNSGIVSAGVAAVADKASAYRSAYDQVTQAMMSVIEVSRFVAFAMCYISYLHCISTEI